MKIAIVGTAPSSVGLVPMSDPSWTIWACSPACAVMLPQQVGYHVEAWFELHRWGPNEDWISAHFREFVRKFQGVLYVNPASLPTVVDTGEMPTAVAYPVDAMLQKFGRYFFTSSISWMLALAIEQNPEEIGIYGVDMSATEEYGYQRAGCHYFIQEAQRRGIKITVPPESDLLFPPPMYGIGEYNPIAIKLLAREKEVARRIADAERRKADAEREALYLAGAAENIKYMRNTYL